MELIDSMAITCAVPSGVAPFELLGALGILVLAAFTASAVGIVLATLRSRRTAKVARQPTRNSPSALVSIPRCLVRPCK